MDIWSAMRPSIFKTLVPPALLVVLKALRNKLRSPDWEFAGYIWPTTSGEQQARGWNDESVASAYAARWPAYRAIAESTLPLAIIPEQVSAHDLGERPFNEYDLMFHNSNMTFAYCLARAAFGKRSIRVLDWGGATGHYYLLAKSLFPDLGIRYECVESPATAAVGRELLPNIEFRLDGQLGEKTFDLVIASGAIHYAEDWRELLRRLSGASKALLFLHQLPIVHRTRSFTVLQRPYSYGYHTEYVGWALNRTDVLKALKDNDLGLVREFIHGFKPDVAGAPEQPEYRSLLISCLHDTGDIEKT